MEFDDNKIYFCEKCYNGESNKPFYFLFKGYVPSLSRVKENACFCCGNTNLIEINITYEEYGILGTVSKDVKFFEAMIQLKKDNIIEFEEKMAQYRAKRDLDREIKAGNILACPKCDSTAVTTGARGVNYFWGTNRSK